MAIESLRAELTRQAKETSFYRGLKVLTVAVFLSCDRALPCLALSAFRGVEVLYRVVSNLSLIHI